MKNVLFSLLDAIFSAFIWLVTTPEGVGVLMTVLATLMVVYYIVKERCGICRRRKWKSKMSCDRVSSNPKLRCCLTCKSIVGPEAMRIAHDLDRVRRPNRLTGVPSSTERPVFKAPPIGDTHRSESSEVPIIVVSARRPPMPDIPVSSPSFATPRR